MLESEVEEYYDSDGDRAYRPRVRYAYKVNGRAYTGSTAYRHIWGTAGTNRQRAELFVQERPAGKLVEVYYDAKRPERSFLVNNANVRLTMFLLLLIPPLLLGLGMVLILLLSSSGGPG